MTVLYERRLAGDPAWAWREADMHFENQGAVQTSLDRITRRLDDLGVAYALVGGMAMFRHGYRRFTEDVDLLVTPDGLRTIHDRLVGLGYLPPFEGSKQLRDADTGVRIEFLVSGGYPGDGKPKPVSFPDPAGAAVDINGVRVLNLPTLIELKLASGLSSPTRLRDLADVQELIRHLQLPRDLAEQLDASVRPTYEQYWDALAAEAGREP